MKKHEIAFSIARVPLDFWVVFFSFFIARELRLTTDLIPGIYLPIRTISPEYLLPFAVFGGALYIILLATHGLYNIQIYHSKIKEFLDILRYCIYWFLFFSVWVYLWKGILYKGAEIPRLIIFFTALLSFFISVFFRILLNILQNFLLEKNIIPRRKLLLISNSSEKDIHEIYQDIKDSGIYEIVWYANSYPVENTNMKYRGNIEKISQYFKKGLCDEILYIQSDFNKKELFTLWELTKIFWIRYRYITNSFDITKTNSTLSLINRTPVVEIKNTPLESWGRVIKRTTDIIGSILGIILSLPFFFIIPILIKIEDPSGPVIYKNRRIGQNGKVFDCLKFRYIRWRYCIKESYWIHEKDDLALEYEKKLIREKSMRNWPLYKIQDDPRKLIIGSWIERFSIDEIPQFINVLKGEMSLVWPRPHQPREVEKYWLQENRLLTVKPGMSGMAQVHGREKNDFKKEAELDIFYIENWSFILDMKIIFKTFWTLFIRK